MDVQLPDGTVLQGVPDGMSKADLTAKLARNGYDVSKLGTPAAPSADDLPLLLGASRNQMKAAGAGLVRGARDIVDTGAGWLASGLDKVTGNARGLSSLVTGQPSGYAGMVQAGNQQGRDEFQRDYGDSNIAGAGRVGGQVLATLPVGGVLGQGAKALGFTRAGNALASAGMTTGGAVAPNLLARGGDACGCRRGGGWCQYGAGWR